MIKCYNLPDEFYQLQVTETRHTPPRELKPNPNVLVDIVTAVGASIDRCAYVGDNLFKDVARQPFPPNFILRQCPNGLPVVSLMDRLHHRARS